MLNENVPVSPAPRAPGRNRLIDDRRTTNRMPIQRDVRYRVLGERRAVSEVGSGKTLNMSSGGVLFTTETGLMKGQRVELTVSWPAMLDNAVPLKLVAVGVLVRADETQAAISIERHEFRTRGAGL
jgi:hypothetical protein